MIFEPVNHTLFMNNAFLLTGGNIGDRVTNLAKAAGLIEAEVGKIIKRSLLYETAAWGTINQQDFLNQVLQVETGLSANKLLQTILAIEQKLGRVRNEKMGPRTIDIDILFYNDIITSSADLVIPHPHLPVRRFVLVPLNEIAPTHMHPALIKTVSQLLEECPDPLEVTLFEPNLSVN